MGGGGLALPLPYFTGCSASCPQPGSQEAPPHATLDLVSLPPGLLLKPPPHELLQLLLQWSGMVIPRSPARQTTLSVAALGD